VPKVATFSLRVAVWTIGLAFVGYITAAKSTHSDFDSTIVIGIFMGGLLGFFIGQFFCWPGRQDDH
jgi:hypothetical protein